jgi:hypothetical protein
MRQVMKYILSFSNFALTMILGLFVFTYTAIHFPTTMRDLLTAAKYIRDQISNMGLPDNYMVWVDIFLQPNQIVLVLFSIAMRLAIDIAGAIFNGGRFPGGTDTSSASASTSPFSRWG